MKWKLAYLGFVVGVLGWLLMSWYAGRQREFPPLPEGFDDLGLEVPDGTVNIKRGWRKGIQSYGDKTPCVWLYYQELDVASAHEMSDSWAPGGNSDLATSHSALIHRIFRFYRDQLWQDMNLGGADRLNNSKYESGVFYSNEQECLVKLDVYYSGFGSRNERVGINIVVVPDVANTRVTVQDSQ